MKLSHLKTLWKPRQLIIIIALALYSCYKPTAENEKELLSELATQVSDFSLTDHRGVFHPLSYYDDHRAVVLFVQGNGCPIVRNALVEFQALQESFAEQGIKFFMINANLQDDRAAVQQEAEAFNIRWPILLDQQQLVANMLDLRVTAEALLIDTETRRVLYRGPISDRLGYETQKETARRAYLQEAIDDFLAGDSIDTPMRKTMGCAITRLSDRRPDHLTYVDDIAPLLLQKCVSCHQEGGIAPWAMSDYRTVLGWSSMIKHVIHTKRMPPWHADPTIGHFSNDLSLSDAEIETLMTWIDGNRVRGKGDDPLAQRPSNTPTWSLGKPDHVLALTPESIPATGLIDYRYQSYDLRFDTDVYVKAVEILPDKTEILHHVLATLEYPEDYPVGLDRKRGPWIDGILAAWAPGMQPETFPEGTGRIIPQGAIVHVQLHYTTNGRAQEDQSKIGFHFLDAPPEREFITIGPTDFDLEILPNDPAHVSTITEKIREDIRVFGFFPHMHYRGKSMKYLLEDPAGQRTTLLSVPNYNFNWQRYYELETPLDIRKGSKIVVEAVFDNSAQNPFNPAPQDTIYFGEQTFDEMMIGFLSYHTL